MNKKFIVPFDTARQLREKGYDVDCYSYYTQNGKLYHDTFTLNNKWIRMGRFLAPTYHEVVDWLEEKGIYICIEVLLEKRGEFVFSSYIDWIGNINQETHVGTYPTREEALNAGILAALKKL